MSPWVVDSVTSTVPKTSMFSVGGGATSLAAGDSAGYAHETVSVVGCGTGGSAPNRDRFSGGRGVVVVADVEAAVVEPAGVGVAAVSVDPEQPARRSAAAEAAITRPGTRVTGRSAWR